jgi:flagellar biosynthesis/type III secretory pathway protein FliH
MNGRKKLRPKNLNEEWREEINNGSKEGWNEKWKEGKKEGRKEGKKERRQTMLYECTWLTHQPLFSFITANFRNSQHKYWPL